jgi:hypothetical protein
MFADTISLPIAISLVLDRLSVLTPTTPRFIATHSAATRSHDRDVRPLDAGPYTFVVADAMVLREDGRVPAARMLAACVVWQPRYTRGIRDPA